jgi:hypothetical protein
LNLPLHWAKFPCGGFSGLVNCPLAQEATKVAKHVSDSRAKAGNCEFARLARTAGSLTNRVWRSHF